MQGIEYFINLTHLSVSHNRLTDLEELSLVANPGKIVCLAVKGNWFDRHPDYVSLLVHYFSSVKELDSVNVGGSRKMIKDGQNLRLQVIPFLYAVD